MRYSIRRDPIWRPLLALFGGTTAGSYVEIDGGTLRFRFGWAFDERIPLGDVADARPRAWPWWGGIGWRLGGRGRIGLIGSYNGVVEVRFRTPRRMRFLGIPWNCRGIAVSLEQPERFTADLRTALPAPGA